MDHPSRFLEGLASEGVEWFLFYFLPLTFSFVCVAASSGRSIPFRTFVLIVACINFFILACLSFTLYGF